MKIVTLVTWCCLWSLSGSAFAQVDQMLPPIGGPGGGQFFARCDEGEILNGFELRVGDDVDAIRALCARALSPTSIMPRRPHASMAGGPGGRLIQLVCPDRTPALAGMLVGWEGVQTRIVSTLRLYCGKAALGQLPEPYPTVSFDGPEIQPATSFGSSFGMSLKLDMQRCPDGLVPVGINGRSGKWVDAVGFVCGPLRVAPPDPNTVKSLGRVASSGKPGPARTICEAAADARARKSPAAASLEAQCRAAPPDTSPAPPPPAAISGADVQSAIARGAALGASDPLAAALRARLTDAASQRGFDLGMGVWAGHTAPGPGKLRYREMLAPNEQGGFDIAAAFSLPRNKHDVLSGVGAAIAGADEAVAKARVSEDDPFFWLGFDIATGIFGDRAAGGQGNKATGPGSLGIRNELNAAGQRGFDAATALHLARKY